MKQVEEELILFIMFLCYLPKINQFRADVMSILGEENWGERRADGVVPDILSTL